MTRHIFLLSALCTATGLLLLPSPAGAATPQRQILFFSKSSGYEHGVIRSKDGKPSHVEKVLNDIGAKQGWTFTCTKDGSVFTPEKLKAYDAVFFYTTGDLTTPGTDKNPPMPTDGKKALLDFVAGGKGFIGTHAASDTFHTLAKEAGEFRTSGANADPYIRMLGGEFASHAAQQEARMRCVDPKFPGMEKIGSGFKLMDEWYSLKEFAGDLHALLVQETDTMNGAPYKRPPYPATWVRLHGKGRVFYTSMGHRDDVWTNPTFQEILIGGIRWALGDVPADASPNIDNVTPGAANYPEPKKQK